MLDKRPPGLVAVIEDDEMSRYALARVLEASGFECELFDSAERFLSSPPARPLLCLIVDVQLAGMSGIELQWQLGCQGSSVPIILVTGNRAEKIRERALAAGCAAFLWKPFSADAILAALTAIARSRT